MTALDNLQPPVGAPTGQAPSTTLPPHSSADRSRVRRDIQGLRAVAVLAVVADHLLAWPRGGFVGVDVFFVISGFLITGLLLREHERTGRISFLGFYRRRARRIIPALVVVLAVTLAASWFVFNAARWRETVTDGIWSLLFAGNWRFFVQSTDYFQSAGPVSPLQHYWSLSVEEQFYFVWPWLLLLIFALATRRHWSTGQARVAAGVAIGLISLASFAWALHETGVAPDRAYFSTFSRVWELGAGALLAVAAPLLARLPALARPVLGWAGLVGVLVSLFLIDPASGFPAPAAALPVLATVLILAAGTGISQSPGLVPLTNPVMGYVGDISYSLYLWHFPVIILGRALFGDGVLVTLGLTATLFVLSVYSFHLLEDPVRKSDWLAPGRRRAHRPGGPSTGYKLSSLSFLALASTALGAAALLHAAPQPPAVQAVPVVPNLSAGQQSNKPALAALQREIAQSLGANRWPTLKPTMEEAMAETRVYDDLRLCGAGHRSEPECTWGDPEAENTIVTVGNSLSIHYARTLRTVIGEDAGWRLVSYGTYGCPFGDIRVQPLPPDADQGCANRPDLAVEAINRLKPKVVVLSGVMSVDAVLSQLRKVQVPVSYVVLPGPPAEKDVTACFTKTSSPKDCVTSVPPEWGRRERALTHQLQGKYIDTSAWFCVSDSCPSFVGQIPTKFDLEHFTREYSDRLAPVVREELAVQRIVRLKAS